MSNGSDEAETDFAGRLTRISQALGRPVSVFFGSGAGLPDAHDAGDGVETYLLELIAAHLRDAEPEARRRFVAAVEAMLQAKPR